MSYVKPRLVLFRMAAPKEALSEQKDHKKLIEKGKPDDILPGFKNRHVGSTRIP